MQVNRLSIMMDNKSETSEVREFESFRVRFFFLRTSAGTCWVVFFFALVGFCKPTSEARRRVLCCFCFLFLRKMAQSCEGQKGAQSYRVQTFLQRAKEVGGLDLFP